MNVSCCLSNFLQGKISLLVLKQESNPKYARGEVLGTFQRGYAFYYSNGHNFRDAKPLSA